jgi:quercetin 2,3-dioxygenase
MRKPRVLTQNLQRRLDSFLMLDAFGSDKAGDFIADFPAGADCSAQSVHDELAG